MLMRFAILRIAIALFACVSMASEMTRCEVTISTSDGLRMRIERDGTISSLRCGVMEVLTTGKRGRFIVDEFHGTRTVKVKVPNGDFETDRDGDGLPDGWNIGSGWSRDEKVKHGGRFSMRVHIAGAESKISGSLRSPRIRVTGGRTYEVSFWMRMERCGGVYSPTGYIEQWDDAGNRTTTFVQIVFPNPYRGTKDWFKLTRRFTTASRTTNITVYFNIYRGYGTAWVDDLEVAEVVADYERLSLKCIGIKRIKDGCTVTYEAKALKLVTHLQERDGYIAVDGNLRDMSGNDRALRITFALPMDALGWTWWDNIIESRIIERNGKPKLYARTVPAEAGDGMISAYPFSALDARDGDVGISLALPSAQGPRIFVIGYDTNLLAFVVRFYLGISPITKHFPQRAWFNFIIYRHDPKWGFRAAAKRYYEFFPNDFKKRAGFEGYLNYARLEPCDDEGNLHLRDAVLPFYTDFGEPFEYIGHFHGCYCTAFEPSKEKERRPSDEHVLQFLRNAAARWRYNEREYAPPREILKKFTLSEDGKIRFHRVKYLKGTHPYAIGGKDGWFYEFRVNEDPDVSDWLAMRLQRLIRQWLSKRKFKQPFHACITIDELCGYTGTGRGIDFRREHFTLVNHPLTYGARTGKLAIANLIYDFLAQVIHPLSERYKFLITGNSNFFNRALMFRFCDLGMVEWEWDRDVPLRTDIYLRTMAYHKLYRYWRVLKGGRQAEKDADAVAMHLKRGLLYAIFPSVWAVQVVGGDLERYRELYRKYVPLIERLSLCGWEPITYAHSSHDVVIVERYGSFHDGTLHFAIRNIDEKAHDVTVRIDARSLGIDDATLSRVMVCELVRRASMKVRRSDGTIAISFAIGAGETFVVQVCTVNQFIAFALRMAEYELDRASRALVTSMTEVDRNIAVAIKERMERVRLAILSGMRKPQILREVRHMNEALGGLNAQIDAKNPKFKEHLFKRILTQLGKIAQLLAP
ncbi:MAG TPA: hypothetical protein EYP10_04290 [Armatimonadetes bacterium]|nr:hypothetical protein [Armatimonadota bacterium]